MPSDISTAQFLLDSIQLNINIKEPNIEQWADEIRLMRERDQRTDNQIRKVIEAATNDPFWSGVCLSAKGLRRNFDKIKVVLKNSTDLGEPLEKYKR